MTAAGSILPTKSADGENFVEARVAEHPLDDHPSADQESETNERFNKIRSRLRRSREKQIGIGGLLAIMAVAAIALAFLRQAGEGYLGLMVILVVLFGAALSFTGLVMLLESARLAIGDKMRQARSFMWFGCLLLFGGLPTGILFAVLAAYLGSM